MQSNITSYHSAGSICCPQTLVETEEKAAKDRTLNRGKIEESSGGSAERRTGRSPIDDDKYRLRKMLKCGVVTMIAGIRPVVFPVFKATETDGRNVCPLCYNML